MSNDDLATRIFELEEENARLRAGLFNAHDKRVVVAPPEFDERFQEAKESVANYFQHVVTDPSQGLIEVAGERYVLVRASALSIDFLDRVKALHGEANGQSSTLGHSLLFDLSHTMGMSDAAAFHDRMGLKDPIAKLSAGPVHFAYTGWALVDIKPESKPVPNDDFVLIYDHPYSFEAESWCRSSRTADRPACIMNAGYSSGWCEESFGIELTAVEVSCRARGDASCTFVMAPPSRIVERLREHFGIDCDAPPASSDIHVPCYFDRNRADRALRESERRYRALFDNINCGAAVLRATDDGSDFVIEEANRSLANVLGTDMEDLVGRPISSAIPQASGHGLLEALKGVHAGGSAVTLADENYGTADHPSWRRHHVYCLGKSELVVVVDDTTDRRRAEVEKKCIEQQLRQSQKMEAIGRLAGGIAHDFNNLLTIIGQGAKFLLEDLDPSDVRRGDAAEIDKAASRAVALTRQLLAFSRRSLLQPRLIDLHQVIFDTESMLQRIVGRDVAIRLQLMDEPCAVLAGESEIEQVIVNLMINARDAMPNGGTVTLSTAAKRVADDPREWVAFSVEDTGVGMPPDVIEHIFEPFFTTKEHGSGTGLGLSTVYGIVKQAGGRILALSPPGGGARIEILLPRQPYSGAVVAKSTSIAPPVPSGHPTVLIVDEDQSVLRTTSRILRRFGYRVVTMTSGSDALNRLQEPDNRPDVVLVDAGMPGLGGFQLNEELIARFPELPIVLMSGHAAEETCSTATNGVKRGLLRKTFTINELIFMIHRVLH